MAAANHQHQQQVGTESEPLLGNGGPPPEASGYAHETTQAAVGGTVTFLFILALVLVFVFVGDDVVQLPRSSLDVALNLLSKTPVIDGHIDLPILVREIYSNNVSAVNLDRAFDGHVDIPRLRAGKVGAFFWSVYVPCAEAIGYDEGVNFTNPSYRVRDTLEQIDISRLLMEKHSNTFELASGTYEAKEIMSRGKVASFLGVEGGHQLGNSLGVLRTYYDLGVRYLTLTHTCHNAFADSGGFLEAPEPLHHGLSPIGEALVAEMNRLGILVDLSHTADATAIHALNISKAPVIWSHSSARAVWNVSRNVPDEILSLIGEGKGKRDAVIMVNFAPYFVAAAGNATLEAVANHIDHIGKVAGKRHVGIGSDFDGIGDTPHGLEDVSKYPHLFAELYRRGWSRKDLSGLAGANLLRVFQGAEEVSKRLKAEGVPPSSVLYDKRTDLPRRRTVSKAREF